MFLDVNIWLISFEEHANKVLQGVAIIKLWIRLRIVVPWQQEIVIVLIDRYELYWRLDVISTVY